MKSCPTPGTVITTNIGGNLHFGAADGLACPVQNYNNGHTFTSYGLFMNEDASVFDQYKDHIAELWPLQVGKKVQFQVSEDQVGENKIWDISYEVTDRENISVIGGTFDVFVVKYHEENIDLRSTQRYEAEKTYYISPALGYVVKYEYKYARGMPEKNQNWEVTSISQPQ